MCVDHTISGYIPADSLTLAKLSKDSEDGGTTSSQVKPRKREVLVDAGNQDNGATLKSVIKKKCTLG